MKRMDPIILVGEGSRREGDYSRRRGDRGEGMRVVVAS